MAHADGSDGFPLFELLEPDVHGPAEIIIAPGFGHIFNFRRYLFCRPGGLDEVSLDPIDADRLLQGIVQVGIGGIDFAGLGPDVFLGQAGNEIRETRDGRLFFRASLGDALTFFGGPFVPEPPGSPWLLVSFGFSLRLLQKGLFCEEKARLQKFRKEAGFAGRQDDWVRHPGPNEPLSG